jgi:DNA invertase Pin-like site-specific DNA recombinase
MLSLLGAFAEYERTLIRERQREGIAKAKERGVYRGRPKRVQDAERIAQIVAEATAVGANKSRIATKHGISRDTLYKYVKCLS